MSALTRLILVVSLIAVATAPAAHAAERMWMGFHDDPVLRWDAGRIDELDAAAQTNATIVRTFVTWANAAPRRPANPSNPFDPAYMLDDVDELVRNAQNRGMEVLITIWGTPRWANGGRTPNYVPTNMTELRRFAQALSARYSGRYPGYPFVRFYGIWNESNLARFLAPQFDARGEIVAPRNYAKLAAAAYAGIKAGSPRSLVAIGETSSHGRDKQVPKLSDSTSPGTFARLLAEANPRLQFDAYAHHPYPYPVFFKPTQLVRWPNVSLKSLPRLERSLSTWFRRDNIPIWITEYGHETKPGEPLGVTEAQQADYLPQAVALAKRDRRVEMFVWFVFRDSLGSSWQSGLYRRNGTRKPALARWASTAPPVDARNPSLSARGGQRAPEVNLTTREICATNGEGTSVGMTYRARLAGKLVKVGQIQTRLRSDCSIKVRPAFTVAPGKRYVIQFDLNTENGVSLRRTVTIAGSGRG